MKFGVLEDLRYEYIINMKLAGLGITLEILEFFETVPALVYPLCNPVVDSAWTPRSSLRKLEPQHFSILFQKLKLMHKTGVLHRDVRAENIVVFL